MSPAPASAPVTPPSPDSVPHPATPPKPHIRPHDDNVMRHIYKELTDAEKDVVVTLKDLGHRFHLFLHRLGDSPELDNAKKKVREAVMWGTQHVTK